MFSEVMEFFGLERELDHLGFFETASQKHLEKELTERTADSLDASRLPCR